MKGKIISEILPELWLVQRARRLYTDRKTKKMIRENIMKTIE